MELILNLVGVVIVIFSLLLVFQNNRKNGKKEEELENYETELVHMKRHLEEIDNKIKSSSIEKYRELEKLMKECERKIAVFDTEQSKYYCQKAVMVIKSMTGVDIDYFKIVGTSNTLKMKIVEKYLEFGWGEARTPTPPRKTRDEAGCALLYRAHHSERIFLCSEKKGTHLFPQHPRSTWGGTAPCRSSSPSWLRCSPVR